MTQNKSPACVFDLDATLSHARHVCKGLAISGRNTDSFMSRQALSLISQISRDCDVFIATGRARSTVSEFEKWFHEFDIQISGWILEHGAVVRGFPEWTKTILDGLDLEAIRVKIERIVEKYNLPIDTRRYAEDHKGFLLFSGNGKLLAEYLLDRISGILNGKFRTLIGTRKIALIPLMADKYKAFEQIFGQTHFVSFAAGDDVDDLNLLRNARMALATGDAGFLVKKFIRSCENGYVSQYSGHEGTVDILERICKKNDSGGFLTRDLQVKRRLPVEEAYLFRPSRQAYLDLIFKKTPVCRSVPDPDLLNSLSKELDRGRNIVIEVRMRDWGGEVKPLAALCDVMIPLLPEAKWKLVFRPERIGVENLKDFKNIIERLEEILTGPENMKTLFDGQSRFCSPGVLNSPDVLEKSSVTLLLYDHPEDMNPWYDRAISRLVTKYPGEAKKWYVNPMYLKISGADAVSIQAMEKAKQINLAGERIMMAANVVDFKDIEISTRGFDRIRDLVDALIIVPRVVTNPDRNCMIEEAVDKIGEKALFWSNMKAYDRPCVLVVDSYGLLPALYSKCKISYLGGGFDPRKRGFDPMESLTAKIPVITGPVYDYNRISIDSMKNGSFNDKVTSHNKWINIMHNSKTAAHDFADLAKALIEKPPDPRILENFIKKRSFDPERVAAEVMADLAGWLTNGYLIKENAEFAIDKIDICKLYGRNQKGGS